MLLNGLVVGVPPVCRGPDARGRPLPRETRLHLASVPRPRPLLSSVCTRSLGDPGMTSPEYTVPGAHVQTRVMD